MDRVCCLVGMVTDRVPKADVCVIYEGEVDMSDERDQLRAITELQSRGITGMSPAARAAVKEYVTLRLNGRGLDEAEEFILKKYRFAPGSDDWLVLRAAVFNPARQVEEDKKNASVCFIATAACGSAEAPDVDALRRFRDDFLARHRLGRWFIQMYEVASPPIAVKVATRPLLRHIVKWLIIRPLARLLG
jgi:hypothetical protein